MTKTNAIKDAQEKANLSHQNQTVFRYIDGVSVRFDYTHSSLWERRRHPRPVVTIVITVTPDTSGTAGLRV